MAFSFWTILYPVDSKRVKTHRCKPFVNHLRQYTIPPQTLKQMNHRRWVFLVFHHPPKRNYRHPYQPRHIFCHAKLCQCPIMAYQGKLAPPATIKASLCTPTNGPATPIFFSKPSGAGNSVRASQLRTLAEATERKQKKWNRSIEVFTRMNLPKIRGNCEEKVSTFHVPHEISCLNEKNRQ